MSDNPNARAYVGALLHLPPERAAAACKLLEAHDLADPRLEAVFGVACDLVAAGREASPPAVCAEMLSKGRISRQAMPNFEAYVATLYTDVDSPLSVGFHAAAVLEMSVRRRVTEAAERLAQVAEQSTVEYLADTVKVEALAIVNAVLRLPIAEVAA